MDNNIYLKFIYKLIKTDQIKEKTLIGNFYDGIEIRNNDIIKKNIQIQKVVIKVKLESDNLNSNKFLLIYDLPINFLISHTIIIGDKSNLFEFVTGNGEILICSKELYLKIKDKLKIKKINQIDPITFQNKKFKFDFELPKIINEIKEFSLKKNKLDLNKIHIVDSSNVEIFIPTIKNFHFKISMNMRLPIISLIKDNFIIDSNINILETSSIIKKLNPFFIFEESIIWNFQKFSNNKLYKDIKKELFIIPNLEKLINLVENSKFTYPNKIELIKNLNKRKFIEFSNLESKIPIPIFKSFENQNFLEIKNLEDFEKISGRKFKLDEDFFRNIYLQALTGEKLNYKKKYLNPKFEKIFSNLDETQNKIAYGSLNELIMKLIFNKNVEEIRKIDILNENKINELTKILQYLIKKIILLSINYNKIPIKIIPSTNLSKYLQSSSNFLNLEFEKYKNLESKKYLLKKTLKKTNKIFFSIKNIDLIFEDLYFFNQFNLILIKILSQFDFEKSKIIKNLFNDYFKSEKFEIKKTSIDLGFEKFIENIALINKFSKKRKIFLIIKNNDFDLNLIPKKNIRILKNYKNKFIIKPNKPKLKEIFKFNYIDIEKQIKLLKVSNLGEKVYLNLKDKKIELKKDFYYIYEIIENYKLIDENKYFKILFEKNT